MTRKIILLASLAAAVALDVAAAGMELTPGQYEYTIKMNMPGAPNMPAHTMQRCITAKDVAGNTAFQAPPPPNSDCQTRDMNQSGGQFSFKVSCTRPEKVETAVKGTYTGTTIAMDMTMSGGNLPGTMTQNITAKRLGDCK